MQIGSTPCASRCASGYDTVTATRGRGPPLQHMQLHCGGWRWPAAACGSRAQGLSAARPSRSETRALTAVDLGLVDPIVQALRRAAGLCRGRRDRLAAGGVLTSLSRTSREARARTSGVNLLVVLLMTARPSQAFGPPANPARALSSGVSAALNARPHAGERVSGDRNYCFSMPAFSISSPHCLSSCAIISASVAEELGNASVATFSK